MLKSLWPSQGVVSVSFGIILSTSMRLTEVLDVLYVSVNVLQSPMAMVEQINDWLIDLPAQNSFIRGTLTEWITGKSWSMWVQ